MAPPLPHLELTTFSDFPLPLTISVVFEMSSEEHVCDLDSASQPKNRSNVKYLSDVWIHIMSVLENLSALPLTGVIKGGTLLRTSFVC